MPGILGALVVRGKPREIPWNPGRLGDSQRALGGPVRAPSAPNKKAPVRALEALGSPKETGFASPGDDLEATVWRCKASLFTPVFEHSYMRVQ